MERIGTGGIVNPPHVSQFAKNAADDFFSPRTVDNRFDKRIINVLRPADAISDTLRFELKGINCSMRKLN